MDRCAEIDNASTENGTTAAPATGVGATSDTVSPGATTQLFAGHYELGAHLGAGGYGHVVQAWDRKLQRHVAIKRINPAEGSALTGNPVREARMGASLRHAAFVKVHAIEDDGPGQSIVMELVPGQTVRQVIESTGAELATALDWMSQVADAMQDAHASGLVHGDLKPSNLMVEPSGRVRILDFGLAQHHDPQATCSVSLAEPAGTIAYMAPERLQGAAPDARSDVFALGVILYELVCGARPHPGLTGLALAAAQVHADSATWAYPDSVSAPVVALIRAMTTRAPRQRPDISEVGRQLRALTGGGATPAGPRPQRDRRRTGALTRWKKAAVRPALALCLTLLTAWQLAPHVSQWVQRAAPYSQALSMRQGLDAVKLADRPGNLDKAAQYFGEVLQRTPDNAAAVAGMSLVYAMRHASDDQDEVWLQKALASSQQAATLDGQLALGHAARGWALAGLGRYEQALQAHQRALQLDPGEYFAWFGKAEALRRSGQPNAAMAWLKLALQRFPAERAFWDGVGVVHFEQGNDRDAEQAFRRSIALQPDAVMAYANLNAALLRQNRQDDALGVLQQGLQIRRSAQLYGNLGNALFLRGDYVGAVAAFENAVSPVHGAPGAYLNWANLADTLLWLPGREAQARQAYAKARTLLAPLLARSPDDVTLLSRMGLYAARAGDQPAARELTRRALALAPANANIQFRAGLAYEVLGLRQLALPAILEARRRGYPAQFIDAEPGLAELRRDPAYPQN